MIEDLDLNSSMNKRATRMITARHLIPVITATLLFAGLTGCNRSKPDENPTLIQQSTPETAWIEAARHVTTAPDAMIVVRHIDAAAPMLRDVMKAGKDNPPARWTELMQTFGEVIGVEDITTATSWGARGLDTQRPLLIAVYKETPVLLAPVTDTTKVQDLLANNLEVSVTTDETGHEYTETASGLSYFIKDGYAWIAEARHPEAATVTCRSCSKMAGTSWAEDPGYRGFTQMLDDKHYTWGLFIPAHGSIYGEAVEELADSNRFISGTNLLPVVGQMTGLGFGVSYRGTQLDVTGWAGLTSVGAQLASKLTTPSKITPMATAVPSETLFFTHIGANPSAMMDLFISTLTPAGRLDLTSKLYKMEAEAGVTFDPEKDIADQLTGEALVMVVANSTNHANLFGVTGFATVGRFDFISTEALAKLTGIIEATFQQKMGRAIPTRDIALGARMATVYQPEPSAPIVIVDGASVYIADPSLDDAALAPIIAASHSEDAQLAMQEDRPRGARALADDAINVMYFNLGMVRQAIPMTNMALAQVPDLDEILIEASVRDDSIRLDANLDIAVAPEMLPRRLSASMRYDSKIKTSKEITRRAMDGAKSYFTTEQKYLSGSASWHPASARNPAGYPLPWSEYTFPGGDNFTVTNYDVIPKHGELMPARPPFPTGSMEARVDAMLGGILTRPSYFKITYSTGPGRGEHSTATIKLEADFDPSTTYAHTITQELFVDQSSQEVISSPSSTWYEYD